MSCYSTTTIKSSWWTCKRVKSYAHTTPPFTAPMARMSTWLQRRFVMLDSCRHLICGVWVYFFTCSRLCRSSQWSPTQSRRRARYSTQTAGLLRNNCITCSSTRTWKRTVGVIAWMCCLHTVLPNDYSTHHASETKVTVIMQISLPQITRVLR